MRKAFIDFLVEQGLVPPQRADELLGTVRTTMQPIGAIAFSYGMITDQDIDKILDAQQHYGRQFGVIAIEMGLLTPDQVNILLCVQQIRAACEVAEALSLARVCPVDDVMNALGQFLSNVNTAAVGFPV